MEPQTKAVYFFGCATQPGHHLHASEWGNVWRSDQRDIPKKFLEGHLDGPFTPPDTWPNGHYVESSYGPWLIISWWDNSVDSRPGSHATFIGIGFSDHGEMIRAASVRFPTVFDRCLGSIQKGQWS